MRIKTQALDKITIQRYKYMLELINTDPPYQREGGIWNKYDRQKLIDSIINGLDVPKIYLEDLKRLNPEESQHFQYAVIDGKQRTEAIRDFANNELELPKDFSYFADESVQAAEMTLADLWDHYPKLAQAFLDFRLSIVSVDTDSYDLVEEMFIRLNNSSTLNAAEARNAIGGAARDASIRLSEHEFFSSRVPLRNARYRYRSIAAKFLLFEYQLLTSKTIKDSKKATLDKLFEDTRGTSPAISGATIGQCESLVIATLDAMTETFTENDPLLRSIGTLSIYYLLFRDYFDQIDRSALEQFEGDRRKAGAIEPDEDEYNDPVNVSLREYNGLVQSTNDGAAIRERRTTLIKYLQLEGSSDRID